VKRKIDKIEIVLLFGPIMNSIQQKIKPLALQDVSCMFVYKYQRQTEFNLVVA